jgi:large subunit ribosomal protein L27e
VVVFTQGRFAGKKAVVVKAYEEGNKVPPFLSQKHRFPHLLVAGIARHVPQVKRTDSKKKFIKKTSVKPFVKYVNQNHVLPTRFLVNEFDLKDIKDDNLKTKESR